MDYERILSAADLEAAYGFILSQAIPVDRNGDVPRIAIFQELNPFAPEQVFCSAVVQKGAETLATSGKPVPVFIRLKTNRWADCGVWKAAGLDTSSVIVKKASDLTGRWDRSNHGPIWGILQMERAED